MTKVCKWLPGALLMLLIATGVARAQAVPVAPALNLPAGTGGAGAVNSVGAQAPLGLGGSASNPVVLLNGVVGSPNGGIGVTNPTAHTIAIPEGASAFTLLTCGANLPLIGQGASVDPICQALNLTNGVTGTLPTANGGFGVASPTAHTIPIAEGASPFTLLTCTGFLIGTGGGADPTCRVLANADLPAGTGIGNAAATAISGTTAGSASCGEPFQGNAGIALKKVTCVLTGYENTTGSAQTYALPLAFTSVASSNFTANCRDPLILTAPGTLTFPVSESATQSCVVVVEGN